MASEPTVIPLEEPLGSSEARELPALICGNSRTASFGVLLAHGAGAPMDHPFLEHFAGELEQAGGVVLRFDYPYMAARRSGASRRPPDRAPVLLAAHRAAIANARERFGDLPLFLMGKSMGSRMAAMLLADPSESISDVAGLIALGYPLHPAGKPDRLRDDFFPDLKTPSLFIQGTRDALCTRAILEDSLPRLGGPFEVHWIEDGDHSFEVPKRSGRTTQAALDEAQEVLAGWIAGRLGS